MARLTVTQTQYLRLNGSNTSVAISSYTPSSTAFSVSMWFQPRTGGANNDRIIDWADAGPVNGFSMVLGTAASTANITFTVYDAVGAVAAIIAPCVFGGWNHLVATYAVNSVKFYLNGVQVGVTDTVATMTTATAALAIGKRATGATNFARGNIRDVIIHSRVISQTEITGLYYSNVIPTSPDVYLKFDELSGTTALDSSTNSRNGTISGTVLYGRDASERTIISPISSSINFGADVTSVVQVTDTAALRPETLQTFTWMQRVFIYDTTNNVLPRFIEKGSHFTCLMGDQSNGKANYMALEIENVDLSPVEYWGTTSLQPNRWYHLATTFDNGTAQHYIDGRPDAMATLLGPFVNMSSTVGSAVKIGNRAAGSRNLAGQMQKVQMHNVALTADEILQSSKGLSVTRGLVAQYNMSEGTGTTVTDTSGNGFNGTLTAGAWVTVGTSRSTASRSTATTRSVA